MNRRYALLAALLIIACGCAGWYFLHGAPIPVLETAGPVADEERLVMLATVLLCAIVVIPVFFLLFYFAWKYRADSPRAYVHHSPDWDHDSRAAEITWWFVPAVIIAILSVIAWDSTHALDPYKPLPGGAALTVDVVALDWKWLFIYPDLGIASVNLLEIPEDTPVHFYLTADAPMNSFWIPALGGQIMVMPGMTTQLNLAADKAGSYDGYSANISGEGFSGMAFKTQAVSESEFSAWVTSIKGAQNPLTESAYDALSAPSANAPVASYAPVASGLFDSIQMKYMAPPGAATSTGMGGMDMSGMMGSMQMP